MPDTCFCFDEVARLHDFFQGWFRGDLAVGDFTGCESALAADFSIVTPGGDLVRRDELLSALRRHHGKEPRDFAIETVGRRCHQVNDVHLVTYEERQSGPRSTIRLSTAAITAVGDGFSWHSVHETWVTG
jgi:hypothetical protein